jgi:predicted enzyme related to lactoylglutathione lyase
MPEVTKHEPGAFSWAELATSDSAGAKAFYTKFFDWSSTDSPAGPDMIYTTLQKGGKAVGALYQQGAHETGMPPHWNAYFTVKSADETAKKAAEAGGKLAMAPFDVMTHGRMAVVQDPEGAFFALWEPKDNIGAQRVGETGAICWVELDTTDPAAAEGFYTKVFPWTAKRSPEYTEWQMGGTSLGGMMKIPEEWGPVPPNWLVYFMVDDVDASVVKAGGLGATPIVPGMDIPNMGRFAVLKDPQGAVFAIFAVTAPAKG